MNEIPDNYDLWESHEAEQERRLAKFPVCADCGNPVQDDHYYLINDEVICKNCLDSNYRKDVEDFVW